MMRWIATLLLAAALPTQADVSAPAEREAYLAYVVAAARVEGNLTSDAALLRLLELQADIYEHVPPEQRSPGEVSLRAEADVLHARLSEKLRAVEADHPELLARGLGCKDQAATDLECDQRKQRLAEVAGDNAYYHLALMAYAWSGGDAAAYLAHARAAAAAGSYASPYTDYYRGLLERFRQVPANVAPGFGEDTGLPRGAVMAMALSTAYAMPPFQGFIGPCREAEGELREHCLAIARLQLASSQTPIETSLAASVIEALGSEQEASAAREKRRIAFWRIEQAAQLFQQAGDAAPPVGVADYFEDYGTLGELEATRRLLLANGRSASPPQAWSSSLSGPPAGP
ncbi:MAG TPA: hypothetical protein VFQ84_11780 [Arenimonas sp.]|uniref:hypothetical protein n=1 Tax=Arenimonas sp. TaxID=1872635 RepID=UPI002D7E7DD4|nr:hypothetical protein [Arenimonas sp.]HEU0154011.1 hypothetical protein [Arenimonas sp.]